MSDNILIGDFVSNPFHGGDATQPDGIVSNEVDNYYADTEQQMRCPSCGWVGGHFSAPSELRKGGTITTYDGKETAVKDMLLPVRICPNCKTELVRLELPPTFYIEDPK